MSGLASVVHVRHDMVADGVGSAAILTDSRLPSSPGDRVGGRPLQRNGCARYFASTASVRAAPVVALWTTTCAPSRKPFKQTKVVRKFDGVEHPFRQELLLFFLV